MTEERKQELRQLLEEAMRSLVIRYGYVRLRFSEVQSVYRDYLQERWKYYGVDFLSYSFSTDFMLDIVNQTIKSSLLDFMKEELARFIYGDDILITVFEIESPPTGKAYLSNRGAAYPGCYLYFVIECLLEIAIVRGIEEAISVFDRHRSLEAAHDLFQDVALLEGVKLETEVEVFKGVRLVPLPSSEISDTVVGELLGLPPVNFRGQRNHFFGKTLLIIDRPGFTRFCRPSGVVFRNGTPINDLPFRVEVPNVKFPNSIAVDSFKKLFCQTLSLVCNAPVRIFHEIWFLAEDKSFNRQYGSSGIPRQNNLLGTSTEAEEADIAKARCLYEILDKNQTLGTSCRYPLIDG